jgi:hypothetical protein
VSSLIELLAAYCLLSSKEFPGRHEIIYLCLVRIGGGPFVGELFRAGRQWANAGSSSRQHGDCHRTATNRNDYATAATQCYPGRYRGDSHPARPYANGDTDGQLNPFTDANAL